MPQKEKLQLNIKEYFKEENYIHYSNCHEDFLMLKKYLNPNTKEVLSIASGLDNSLSFLVDDNVHVLAFDNNPSQIALCHLKATAIKCLSYEEFLILLGLKVGDRIEIYSKVSQVLDLQAKEYFDSHLFLIEMGLIHIGRFEYYFRLFRKKIFPFMSGEKNIKKFADIDNLEEQRTFYNKKIKTWRFNLVFKIFFSKKVMAKTGRDVRYFKYSKGHLHTLLKERVDRGFYYNINKNNPYFSYVLKNTYDAKPFYLEEENFNKIKKNINNLTIVQSDFKELLNKKYDFMNLSDLFEYIDEAEMENYEKLVFNCLNSQGKVAFWNMMNIRQFSSHKRINSDKDLDYDRAFFYRDFLVYENDWWFYFNSKRQ